MNNDNQNESKRKIVSKYAMYILILLILWIMLFGCRLALFMPQKLTQAKNLWDSKNVTHYEVVVYAEFAEIKLEVLDDQVIKAMWRGGLRPDKPFEPFDQEQIIARDLQKYTIEGLFQQIESVTPNMGIIDINGRILLDFDPGLGFPKLYEINDCGVGGLLSPGIGHCASSIRVKSITILN